MRSFTPTEFVAPTTGAPNQSFVGDVLAGRYVLMEPLGKGAASRVFLARDDKNGHQVAVKILPPYGSSPLATPERFDAELTAGRSVEHPNIAQILDAGTSHHDEPFFVTEALTGETLGERLHRIGYLGVRDALGIVRKAARGLAAIHRAGYVHRDVKPDNIFLCDTSRHGVSVKVIDFGFCTHAERTEGSERDVLGTLEYIAPEQAIAETIDGRADVYSIGVVLFRCITGHLPFDDCARPRIISHHLMTPLPPPSWLIDDLEAWADVIVLSATRKHPANRYGSMDHLLEDLDAALSGEPVRGAPLHSEPDFYEPTTEEGRIAFDTLTRRL